MLGVSYLPSHIHRGMTAFASVFTDSRNVESFEALVSALIMVEANWTITNLTDEISRADAKSRRAYDDFLGTANWSIECLAQQLVEYFCDELGIDAGDECLLHIDDTFVAKTGDATDGVGRFRNPCTGEIEWGNVFVTSCLQVGETVVPYRVRMYLAEQAAADRDEPFKKKTDIALEEIITPLQLPVGAALTVVFDSAYYRSDIITSIQRQGYDVICRLKSDKHVRELETVGTLRVDALASTLAYEPTTITVRGREKTYHVASDIVVIEDVGRVKLVVSKTDETCRYYLCTDLGRSPAEILTNAEARWNIETVHEESNAKFGFKQYQLRRKQAIERFLHLGFVAWTLVTLTETPRTPVEDDRGGLGVRLDQAKVAYLVETLIGFVEDLDRPLSLRERRRQTREFVLRCLG
jgi:hypothetical protein